MADALHEHNKTVQVLELTDDDHWLSHPATRLKALEAIEAFLHEHL
jgi:dipeptidyl aminopeptidase/acylaminoacyl peptidase